MAVDEGEIKKNCKWKGTKNVITAKTALHKGKCCKWLRGKGKSTHHKVQCGTQARTGTKRQKLRAQGKWQ